MATKLHCPNLGRRTADTIQYDADRLAYSLLRTWRIVVNLELSFNEEPCMTNSWWCLMDAGWQSPDHDGDNGQFRNNGEYVLSGAVAGIV